MPPQGEPLHRSGHGPDDGKDGGKALDIADDLAHRLVDELIDGPKGGKANRARQYPPSGRGHVPSEDEPLRHPGDGPAYGKGYRQVCGGKASSTASGQQEVVHNLA
jgi:hypothetical protein